PGARPLGPARPAAVYRRSDAPPSGSRPRTRIVEFLGFLLPLTIRRHSETGAGYLLFIAGPSTPRPFPLRQSWRWFTGRAGGALPGVFLLGEATNTGTEQTLPRFRCEHRAGQVARGVST